MPFAHRIHPALDLAVFRFRGEMSVAQATRAFLDYVADPGFDPRHTMLTDSREVTAVEADLHRILHNVANLIPKMRAFPQGTRSIVLVADAKVHGHVRMLQKAMDWTSPIVMLSTFSLDEAMDLSGHPGLDLAPLLPPLP